MIKLGDKVLIEAHIGNMNTEDEMYFVDVESPSMPLYFGDRVRYWTKKVLPINQKTYEDGLSESWELAKRLFADMKQSELEEIFGKHWSFPGIMQLTPQEAAAKIKAWEESKEIEVGDVVYRRSHENPAIVTRINESSYYLMFSDGSCGEVDENECEIKKIGKHIDINSILDQIR